MALLPEVALLRASPQLAAQRKSYAVLAGVDSVDARVSLTWDKRIPSLDESTVRSRLQTVFELELRQRGIVVSTGAFNYLNVSVTTLSNEDGTVSYAYGIALSEPGFPLRVFTDLLLTGLASLDMKKWQASRTLDTAYASLELRAQMLEKIASVYDTTTSALVISWQGPSGVAHAGSKKLYEGLEKETTELAQAFANAYLAVHAKR